MTKVLACHLDGMDTESRGNAVCLQKGGCCMPTAHCSKSRDLVDLLKMFRLRRQSAKRYSS